MANFVYDNVQIQPKKEIDPVPAGAGAVFFGAADFNGTVKAALEDLRAAIINGEMVGFALQDAAPDVDQASLYFIYARSSDGHLIYSLNGTEHDLLAGGGGGGSLQDAYVLGNSIAIGTGGGGEGNGPVVILAKADGSTDSLFEVQDRASNAIMLIEDNGTGGVVGIRHLTLTGISVVATGGSTGDVWTYNDDASTWTPQPIFTIVADEASLPAAGTVPIGKPYVATAEQTIYVTFDGANWSAL